MTYANCYKYWRGSQSMLYEKINFLPIFDLKKELSDLLQKNKIQWKDNQICLNCTNKDSFDYSEGVGSLRLDWQNQSTIIDDNGNEKIHVPEKEIILEEKDFNFLCRSFDNTLFEDVYRELTKHFKLGRVRLMESKPKTCLSWHKDSSKRLHFPIKTQEGCYMVIDNEVCSLEENSWYITDTTLPHTAFNASKEDRIHLVACILGEH